MLSYLGDGTEAWRHKHWPSERKLRLFACAAARLMEDHPFRRPVIEACEKAADSGNDHHDLQAARESIQSVHGWTWAATWPRLGHALELTLHQARGNAGSFYRQNEVAHILRDLIGNPWHPLTLSRLENRSGGDRVRVFDPPYITPQAIGLAETVYEENGGLECPKCLGIGAVRNEMAMFKRGACVACNSTGVLNPGTLDGARLAVLSDALEEGGCPAFETVSVPVAQGVDTRVSVPHPLLSHLRSPGPHYRGMWSLDLILGRS